MDAPGKVPDSINCHACSAVIDLTGLQPFTHVECPRCGALSVVPMHFANFLLLSALGIGGMGTVYKAIDLSLNRYLALKILRPKLAANQQFIDNFSREARAAAAVGHPNIAQVYSFGEVDGQYYLAMELLERGSLDDRMSKLGKLAEMEVLEFGSQIASGLRAAYTRGLLHRDVKPGNILFNDEGIPKIVDFGLARHTQTQQHSAGEPIWGTPYYIAPEKLRGQPEDFRSDIYSLGASLFHALAGRPPFDAATAGEVVTKHATQPVFSLKTYAPTTHDATARVIGRMLAKNPAERYESYDELINDLKGAQAALKTAEKTIVAPTGERVSIGSMVGTVAALIACVFVVWAVWNKFNVVAPSPPPAPTTGETNSTTSTPPQPVKPDYEVDFNVADAPWVNVWSVGMQQAALGNYPAALTSYGNAIPLLTTKPKHKEWIYLFEAFVLMADNQQDAAHNLLVRQAPLLVTSRGIPDTFTATTFVDLPVRALVGDLPLADFESLIPRLPAWAAAIADLTKGFKQREAGEFQKAAGSFRNYSELAHTEHDKWAFQLMPFAERLATDCDSAAATLAQIEALRAEEKFEEALNTLRSASEKATWPALKTALVSLEPLLAEALKKQQEKIEMAHLEAERIKREQEDRERMRVEQEAKLIQVVEPEVAALATSYDFAGALAKYEPFDSKIKTGGARLFLEARMAAARLLVEFKKQLASDFTKRAYDRGDLKTRNGSTLTGRLSRATDTQLIFATQFGDILTDWRDLAPSTLMKLAEFYAAGFSATEKPDVQARRYLRLAAFARAFSMDASVPVYVRKAISLSPDIQKEAVSIFGKTATEETPPATP